MTEIVENSEADIDTIGQDAIEQQFSFKYKLLTETAVSLKKSYINKLHGNTSLKLAVSQSDNTIEVYQLINSSIKRVCRLSGHQKAVGDVVFHPKEDHLLYSAGLDGLVKLWDTRSSGCCAQEFKDDSDQLIRPYECMDISCNGRVICSGSSVVEDDAYLVFWDLRVTTPMGGYWNSHTDDVTQVKFHKEKPEILASGSIDGLLNIYNITEDTEDDALTYSLNVQNAIEKISWLGDTQAACVSLTNDLQIWNTDTGDLVKTYSRDKVAKSIKRSRNDDCYLVDTFVPNDLTPVLLAGSYGGKGNVLRSTSITEKKLLPCTNFKENKQIVRCCWHDKENNLLVTAGESGFISVWKPKESSENIVEAASTKLTKTLTLHSNRHTPY